MSKVKDENYYQISGWMVNRLGLKGTELQVFAIIYGFSQDGESVFTGSLSYLGDWLGVSKPTVIKSLKDLVDKNYLIKDTKIVNGVVVNQYKANIPYITNFNGSKDSLQGSKDSLQGSKDSLHNNTIYNNIYNNTSHISSKDDIFDKGRSTRSETSHTSSGKLFNSEKPKTKKSSIQKINNFISTCQREAIKKEFSQEVLAELDKYFRMLAEMNCLLPALSIAEQLSHLKKVSEDRQISVIKNTISRGWKSLQYEADSVMTNSRPSWDTAEPGTFKATPEEDKNGDWKKDIPDDHIF